MTDRSILYIVGGVIALAAVIAWVILGLKSQNQNDIRINKNGILVKVNSPKKIRTKDFVSYMKEIISYIEEAKENYVDDVIGIKHRYFKQSKDFAKSRIEAVKNEIIEAYKVEYMKKYRGNNHTTVNSNGEKIIDPLAILPTLEQLENGEKKAISPCSAICTNGCNSGLSFFDSRIQKDFKPLLEEVYRIIEENHLVNRNDREYEEEIMMKAAQLSSYLKNIILSYPVPIDNNIAKTVIDKKCPDVKDAIADCLRRSRTLSVTKREEIDKEKARYIERRDKQIAQIINILGDEDTTAILSECNSPKEVD